MNKMSCDLHEMLNLLIDYENQIATEKKKGTVIAIKKELQEERQSTKKEASLT